MSGLHHAQSFRDLIVYQKSRQLQREIFKITKSFPREETFSLTDQIRRSFRSIGSNTSESWAKRRCEKHFISKLTDPDGEQMETQHWIETALDCGEPPRTLREDAAVYLADSSINEENAEN